MHIVMPWFLPVGITLGALGFRTALIEKRARGGRWRADSFLLALLVWVPMILWFIACIAGPFE